MSPVTACVTPVERRTRQLARWSAVPTLLSLALTLDPAPALANGEPEKVVDGRYVVRLVLVPERDAMSFRFSFREFRTGRSLTGPIAYRVKLREGHGGRVLFESPELQTTTSVAEVRYRVPRDGFYETFLEFRRPGVAGAVYKPDDWYVWIPASMDRAPRVPWTGLGLLAAVLVGVWWWRRHAVRHQRGGHPNS